MKFVTTMHLLISSLHSFQFFSYKNSDILNLKQYLFMKIFKYQISRLSFIKKKIFFQVVNDKVFYKISNKGIDSLADETHLVQTPYTEALITQNWNTIQQIYTPNE